MTSRPRTGRHRLHHDLHAVLIGDISDDCEGQVQGQFLSKRFQSVLPPDREDDIRPLPGEPAGGTDADACPRHHDRLAVENCDL